MLYCTVTTRDNGEKYDVVFELSEYHKPVTSLVLATCEDYWVASQLAKRLDNPVDMINIIKTHEVKINAD